MYQFTVEYRHIHEATVENSLPRPHIDGLLEYLCDAEALVALYLRLAIGSYQCTLTVSFIMN